MLSLPAIFALALALSMDAFAVAICYGLALSGSRRRAALLVGAFFGVFQALMPLLGGGLGAGVASVVQTFAPALAFLLLAAIGGKMIHDSFRDTCPVMPGVALLPLAGLAVATSIDALAAGFSLALLGHAIIFPALLIGLTTFVISAGGVLLGALCGSRLQQVARAAGGTMLILIGIRILAGGNAG